MITDLRSFEGLCYTKFRFAEREAQCILGECGPLSCYAIPFYKFKTNPNRKRTRKNKSPSSAGPGARAGSAIVSEETLEEDCALALCLVALQ